MLLQVPFEHRNTPATRGQACHSGVPDRSAVPCCHHVAVSAFWMPSTALPLESKLATLINILFCPACAPSPCLHAVYITWYCIVFAQFSHKQQCLSVAGEQLATWTNWAAMRDFMCVASNHSLTYKWQLHATLSLPQQPIAALGTLCKQPTGARILCCRIACYLCQIWTMRMMLWPSTRCSMPADSLAYNNTSSQSSSSKDCIRGLLQAYNEGRGSQKRISL